tara:strand:+ start:30 stop:335 length:306 start_codon:yes stop_codon:yes gene_type:complete
MKKEKLDITRALVELSLMFDVNIEDIVNFKSRKANIIDARRFLIYYLYTTKRIPHYHMKQYIKGIHHATSIYHCKIINNFFDINEPYRRKYFDFVYKTDWA